MIALGIIGIIVGVVGITYGIARAHLCIKQDQYVKEENAKLQELNDSLHATRKSLEKQNELLSNSNKEFQIIFEENTEKAKILTCELNQLIQLKQEKEYEIKIQEQQKIGLEAQMDTLSRSIIDLTSNQKEALRAAFESYCDALDFEYKEKEREFDGDIANLDQLYGEHQDAFLRQMAANEQSLKRRRIEIENDLAAVRLELVTDLGEERVRLFNELDTIKSELAKIKSTREAAIKAQLREQEIKDQATFYTLQLNEADMRDVAYLKSIEFNLREARPLRMLIWSTFYRDKLNDLATRVGATGACGIYKITHIESGISYIGQAKDIKTRWADHVKCALGIDTPVTSALYAFMREKGVDNFTFEILETCSATELNEKEKTYIDMYQTYEYGLNGNKGISK